MGLADPGSFQLRLPVAKALEAQVQGLGVGSLRRGSRGPGPNISPTLPALTAPATVSTSVNTASSFPLCKDTRPVGQGPAQ